ncbi:assimilatory sulfite reductase (NADPH) flavoprotein subunit [Buchnera aphidicola (Mindarus keteleerifoliae)]|uniref:assimilatory sulfite reductase (NADPH) flavoprotein subunit n=1 Tax=Buchnera aphidicola TaxID=9 RepID=UPI0031B6E452
METKNNLNFFHPLNKSERKILDTLVKDLSDEKRIWLSGYFWGISSYSKNKSLNLNNLKNKNSYQITILCASQTGNSRIVSKSVQKVFKNYELSSKLINVSDYKVKNISKEKILVLIISTQGEGEPPEEALFLHRFLFSRKSIDMSKVHYAVFGLGDSSYDFFCQAGKDFDNRISELGGKRLLDRVDADIEYSELVHKWGEKLSIIIKKNFFSKIQLDKKDFEEFKYKNNKNVKFYDKENPYFGTVLFNKKITGRNSNKIVNHIEIDLSDSGIKYKPGDVIGVWFKNDSILIENLLRKLKIDSNSMVFYKGKKENIFDLLKKKLEITVNTKKIVQSYNVFAKSNELEEIISDNSKIKKYVKNFSFLEMIHQNPIEITADQLVSILRPLTPRLYSISSSQKEINDEVHLTVGLLKYWINNRLYTGGASNYLINELKEGEKISIFVKKNKNFRLPKNIDSQIIMISVGTGIAPFRAFLQERENNKSKGKNWLFFGNQYFTEDFLYQVEWQQYFRNKLLTKIDLAWSRDQKKRIYVQDKIYENSLEIWRWITLGAYIYVCGSINMEKKVEQTFLTIFKKYGHMDQNSAESFLFNLKEKKRYQRDVY